MIEQTVATQDVAVSGAAGESKGPLYEQRLDNLDPHWPRGSWYHQRLHQEAVRRRQVLATNLNHMSEKLGQVYQQLEAQSVQLAEWNRTLENRVAEQLVELERVGRLKRFCSPQVAELIVSSGDERFLESIDRRS